MHYSSHLQWMIIRNNNAYLLKKRNIKKPFSTEPNNLTNLNSYRYNGLVHRKSVGIVAAPDNKGFTCVTKRAKATFKPAKSNIRTTWKVGPRRALWKLKRMLSKSNYRNDLIKPALRRASAVVRSQKPVRAKKARAKKE